MCCLLTIESKCITNCYTFYSSTEQLYNFYFSFARVTRLVGSNNYFRLNYYVKAKQSGPLAVK